jgi:AcrR family transcriptional regulator
MRDRIVEASVKVLVQRGLTNWTVDEVAKQAGCAKGLVTYHHRSKQELLEQTAKSLRDRRLAFQLDAAGKPAALDRLWQTLIDEVQSGRFSAWLSLLGAGTPLRTAAGTLPEHAIQLANRLEESLDLAGALVPHADLIAATLDGLEIRLLTGTARSDLEESYHRFWLSVIDR